MLPVPSLAAALLASWMLLPAPLQARDRGADGDFDQRRSSHFRLLQDVDIDRITGPHGSRAFERAVLDELEQAHKKVERLLDLRPRRDIQVVIYDPGVFESSFGSRFRFSAAGFYDGDTRRIHVRGDIRVDPALVRTLHHEYFHAALDAEIARGRVPAWFNEGFAQWFENLAVGKKGLAPAELNFLSKARQRNAWLPLERLSGPTLADLGQDEARVGYLEAYAMADHLMRTSGARHLRRFVRALQRGGAFDRLMERDLRTTPAEVLQELAAELQ